MRSSFLLEKALFQTVFDLRNNNSNSNNSNDSINKKKKKKKRSLKWCPLLKTLPSVSSAIYTLPLMKWSCWPGAGDAERDV